MAKKMSPLDAGWLMMETRETPMHVGGLALFDLPENAAPDFLLNKFEQMRSHAAASRPFNLKARIRVPIVSADWVPDPQFDIDYHFRHAALPYPGRVRDLLALVSRLHAQRLDRSRPLWEMYLIEGIEGNRFAVYTKMHHALIDGVGAMNLLMSRLASAPTKNLAPPWSADWEKPRATKKSSGKAKGSALEPLKNLGRGSAQLYDMMRQPKASHEKAIYKGPKTLFNQRVTGARRLAAQSWSMARIRKVAKARNATVNDIFLAMCAGCMRDYLLEHDALPAEPLVAQVPVALRSADQADDGGNAITAVQVSLATDVADSVERLEAIQASMKAIKKRLGAMDSGDITAFTLLTNLPLSMGQVSGLSGRVKPMFNLVISNVPGPKESLYLGECELQAHYPVSLIWHGYAINMTVFSYKDRLDFGIIACRDTVPRVQRMLDQLESALAALE